MGLPAVGLEHPVRPRSSARPDTDHTMNVDRADQSKRLALQDRRRDVVQADHGHDQGGQRGEGGVERPAERAHLVRVLPQVPS